MFRVAARARFRYGEYMEVAGSAVQGGAAGGHWGLVVLLRNKGTETCRMQGWPEVFGLDENANLAGGARHTLSGYLGGVTSNELPVIDLASGGITSALVEGTSVNGGQVPCTQYHGLEVTLPGGDDLTKIDGPFTSCDGMQVHPVVPGTSGRQNS